MKIIWLYNNFLNDLETLRLSSVGSKVLLLKWLQRLHYGSYAQEEQK